MNKKHKKISKKHLVQHETKRKVLIKFILFLSIFMLYLAFIVGKYGLEKGFLVSLLTWSFFVLCTPVADAGFLIDFPLRLVTNLRMLFSEIIVWIIAIGINVYTYLVVPKTYKATKLLSLFKHILDKPWPFYAIILISMIGTFVSIQFGDELIDKTTHKERRLHQKHKNKYKMIIMIFIFVISFVLYDFLLQKLNIKIL